jgi:O-antigen/teichoic acid export membrane protein
MVAGSAIQFALPYALGSAEAFGLWGSVTDLLSPVSNVMVTSTIQGVSRFSSGANSPAEQGAVVRTALGVGALLGVGLLLLFLIGAPVAAAFQHDPSVVVPLRLAGGVVLCYSLYAVLVGAANGQRRFRAQAGLDVLFSTMRALLVVGAAVVTHSVLASVGGFVLAAGVILGISVVVVGVPRADGARFEARTLLAFLGSVAAYLIAINLLMFVDGLVLKRLVAESQAALGALDPAREANIVKGHYQGVQNLARLPYQLLLAVTFVIFPLISRSTFEEDRERTRRYVVATLRYSLLVVALMCTTAAARPEALLRLLYKADYAVGATALALLVAAYGCFALSNIACTILNGAGRPLESVLVAAVSLATAGLAAFGLIGRALGADADPLAAAALSTLLAMGVGLLLAAALLYRHFGAVVPLSSLLRTALAIAAAVGVGRLWPSSGALGGKLGTLASLAAVGGVFVLVSVGSRELVPRELLQQRRGA